MNPIQKIYRNRPTPVLTSFQATRKRKTKLESRFEKEYPNIKFEPRSLSLKFIIPLEKIKEMITDKPKLIKYIYNKIDLEKADHIM
jgi:hypothetical protein